MGKKFQGRSIVGGSVEGEAVVSRQGFNSLAVYKHACLTKAKVAYCSDQSNPDLFNKQISDKIICLPQIVGSTSAGVVNATAASMGIEPKAYLFANHIDTLGAAGAILTKNWIGKSVIYIDQLGKEFLEYVKDGMKIMVSPNGEVEILD